MRDSDEWIIQEVRVKNSSEHPIYPIGTVYDWPEPESKIAVKDMRPRTIEQCGELIRYSLQNRYWRLQLKNVKTGEIIPGEIFQG